jgi:hypothetical protein
MYEGENGMKGNELKLTDNDQIVHENKETDISWKAKRKRQDIDKARSETMTSKSYTLSKLGG